MTVAHQTTATNSPRERLLATTPLSERAVELAGVPTAILEGGSGSPVVLLHGPGEFALTWTRVVPELAQTHRVIAPDLPGHGASGLPDGTLDTDRVLRWLAELLEHTCTSPPVLAGHLLGGAIAARFAAARPNDVRRLVLVDSYGLAPFRPALSFGLAMFGFVVRPTERSRDRLFDRCFVDLDGLRDEVGDPWDDLEAYALDRARSDEMQAALRSMMPRFALRRIADAELRGIPVPTVLIWGREDLQVRLRVAEAASERYGWPLHVIDGAADDPAVEQPAAFLRAFEDEDR